MNAQAHHPWNSRTLLHRNTLLFVAMAMIGALAQGLSVELWIPSLHEQMLWLPGASLMCALLSRPPAEWSACIAGTFVGVLGVLMAFNMPLAAAACLIFGLLALVPLASWPLLSSRLPFSLLEDYQRLAFFLLIAAIALPLLGGTWAWLVLRWFDLEGLTGNWSNLVLAQSVSYLMLVPGFVAVLRLYQLPERRPTPGRSQLALGLFFLLALYIAWTQPWPDTLMHPVLALAAAMLLTWTLLVFGTAGAYILMFCCTLLCTLTSSLGLGPLAMDSEANTALAIQLWALGASSMLLLLATLVEQRQTARLSLEGANRRLTSLTSRLVRVQEEERARIARDLHDDINQSLASISIELSTLKRKLDPEWKHHIEYIQEQLLEVSGDVRGLSHELHPSLLRYATLTVALQDLCDRHSANHDLQLHCDFVPEDLALDNEQKLNLFRITQESIHNVTRHAHATNVWIRLRPDDDSGMVLQVDDDGIGLFRVESNGQRRPRPGLGIVSIEERARLLGGTSELKDLEGGGCRLEVRFPLSRPGASAIEEEPLSQQRWANYDGRNTWRKSRSQAS
jgi:signal transduction histidine kinase